MINHLNIKRKEGSICLLMKKGFPCLLLLIGIFSHSLVHAEVKIFDKLTKWCAAKDQSQSQAEKLAVLEAQQQAIEEAGIFISSLTVVKGYKLEKDEITKLASAILQTKTPDTPELSLENKTYCVRVRTIIQVDTSTLTPQIEAFMKDKGAQKKAEMDAKTIRELKEQMANLKSSDDKRLEELNAQALAVERESQKQRLIREEQALKAKGELSKAEADRFAKEREMHERISRALADQENAKRDEAAAIAAEQDRIRRVSLENEQRMNDLLRRVKLSQESWGTIDDSLSFKQALEEVKGLKEEIANLKKRLDYQYGANTVNLKNAYAQQRSLTIAKLPPKPLPKDAFETTLEYNNRIAVYGRRVKEAEVASSQAIENLKKEECLKLAEAKVEYLVQQVRVLAPFVERLAALQTRKFILPEGGAIQVYLGEPDADNNRFPINLQYNDKSWSTWWNYTDRNNAKNFYQLRTHLKADGFFQLEETEHFQPKLTVIKVTHLAMREEREFSIGIPNVFSEIGHFVILKQEEAQAKYSHKKAAKMVVLKESARDGRFIAYDDGTVLDTLTYLMWAAKDNGSDINWQNARSFCENYRGGGYADWRMPTLEELRSLYDIKREFRLVTDLINITYYYIWSSDTESSPTAGFFLFGTGNRGSSRLSNTIGFRALPVRSNKEELMKVEQENSEMTELVKMQLPLEFKEISNDGHIIVYDNGTVLDKEKNLMWATKDNGGYINWEDARTYCKNYRGGGYTDWRMPKQSELAGLYKSSDLKGKIKLSDTWVWASESEKGDSVAAIFRFINGTPDWANKANDNLRALPVRSVK